MCGLVAIISKDKFGFNYKDKTLFLQMLISDMFRGMDSTGCFGINKYGNLKMVKDASPASMFINKKDANTFFNDFVSDYHIVVGHNRKATMGATISENAHPFIEGNICLVHNGTLQNHYKLAQRTVDSNAVAAHIEEHGYKSLLKNIEGAYALIWYNIAEKTLYFTRNAERPLHLVETATKIYLASEAKMLDWLLDRNDVSKYTIQNVPTDKVFKYNLETRKLEAETKPKKAEAPKNKVWDHNKYQSGAGSTTSGQLALVHSSTTTGTKASIESYATGDRVSWRLLNWEMRNNSYKLEGETTDGLRTPVCVYLTAQLWTQSLIDELINSEWLASNILTISQKAGNVRLYLKAVAVEHKMRTANGKSVSFGQLEAAGNCCYSCGTVLSTKQEVSESVVSVNSRGEIQFITCGPCSGGHIHAYC